MNAVAALIVEHVLRWRKAGEVLIIGLCGPQASGKSTAAAQVAVYLEGQGIKVGVMSLDDLYLGRAARSAVARDVHALFATRGPPGTHDVTLGLDVLAKMRAGEPVLLPRFSKALDEPLPQTDWQALDSGCDVLLFEGWCVGARPQADADLVAPVNALERDEDAACIWRRAINAHLAGATGELFAHLDRLICLRAPGFEVVHDWRCEQEHDLVARAGEGRAPAAMSDHQIARFIAHFERITRHIAVEMPGRADLLIDLDRVRNVVAVSERTVIASPD
jgi:D-glycerate 3-kinase